MPTRGELEDLRAELFADDVELPDEHIWRSWTEVSARAFFESGGDEEAAAAVMTKSAPTLQPSSTALPALPPSAPNPLISPVPPAPATPPPTAPASAPASAPAQMEMRVLLEELALVRLHDHLAHLSLAEISAMDRATLLSTLKATGVAKLSDRQKLANEISRRSRAGPAPTAVSQPALPPRRPTGPPHSDPEPLPRPGAPAAARRKLMPPLPPYQRLSTSELREAASRVSCGEWYGLPLPTLDQLPTASFGAAWLTRAFHGAGTLASDDAVEAITAFEPLETQGLDAQGGAGHKAVLRVRYAKPDNGLHTELFVKTPWEVERFLSGRVMLSVQFGDGDGRELTAYQRLEALLPMRIPQYYFGDISRASTWYVLITECVPYAARPPTATGYRLDWRGFAPGTILPKSGKYQDDRLVDAHLYYYALFRAMARMAAADRVGVFDEVMGTADGAAFSAGGLGGGGKLPADSKVRREMTTRRVATLMDVLIEFVRECASGLFGAHLGRVETLERIKREMVEMAPFHTAAQHYLASHKDLVALSHPNLQIDNAFFWRAAATDSAQEATPSADGAAAEDVAAELECGLLDWYNVDRMPTVGVWMGSLSGVEPHVLAAHEEGLMRCYSAELHKYGGPLIDPVELQLQFRLSFITSFAGNLQFIETDIRNEGPTKAEWATITDRWDPRIMGRWNVRCRTVAIMQLLAFYEAAPLYQTFTEWVRANPDWCKEPQA